MYHARSEMRQSLASQSFINNEKLFKESQESYLKKNQNVIFFFFQLFYFMSNDKFALGLFWVCLFFVCRSNSIYFTHITSVTILSLGGLSRLIG